jgi:hypothetical protein
MYYKDEWITYDRQRIYEEVWQEPMVKVGKRYGMSDVGFRKICVQNNIPVPLSGIGLK